MYFNVISQPFFPFLVNFLVFIIYFIFKYLLMIFHMCILLFYISKQDCYFFSYSIYQKYLPLQLYYLQLFHKYIAPNLFSLYLYTFSYILLQFTNNSLFSLFNFYKKYPTKQNPLKIHSLPNIKLSAFALHENYFHMSCCLRTLGLGQPNVLPAAQTISGP